MVNGKYIEISTLDDIKPDNFEITINGNGAKISAIENRIIKIEMPEEEKFQLKITARNKISTPRFYQIRILK